MITATLTLFASFILTLAAVKALKPLAYGIHLTDQPGGRKRHNGKIPLVGGLSIYLSVLIGSLLFFKASPLISSILLCGGIIVLMGAIDDRFSINAKIRLATQFIVACIFVFGLDLNIQSFGNILGLGEVRLGWLSGPISVVAIVSSINAFNMLDGMDGLVGTVSAVSFVGLGLLFGQSGDIHFQYLCLSFVGALSAFLIFNILGKPKRKRVKKVFMGDAGSMFLGLMIGVLAIYGSQEPVSAFSPITATWFVLLPLLDMISIMLRRIRIGKSPFVADRTHLHHVLLRSGISKYSTLNVISEVQVIFVATGITLFQIGDTGLVSFLMVIFVVSAYQVWSWSPGRFIRWNRRRQERELQEFQPETE